MPSLSRPILISLVIATIALAAVPFVSDRFHVQLITQILVLATFAMSLDLLVGFTGLVSFGHAAFFGIAAYTAALLSPKYEAANLWLTFPAAVLIRSIQPVEGIEIMMERRKGGDTLGPGKLTQALGITKSENQADLTGTTSGLWIEAGVQVPNSRVTKSPRVGLNNTPEPWLSKPWRFLVKGWKIDF